MAATNVYYLKSTSQDDDLERPDIDVTDRRNQSDAWNLFHEIIMGRRPVSEYKPLKAYVNFANIEEYHGYGRIAGIGTGFYSKLVVDAIEQLCPGQAKYLPVSINGTEFFAPYIANATDALDKQKSKITYFPTNPNKVLTIDHWEFDFSKLLDPSLFVVPEMRQLLFITSKLAVHLERLNSKGLDIFRASGLPPSHLKWQRRTVRDELRE